jgi:hypothetical protein
VHLFSILRSGSRALDAVSESFSPSHNATSAQVRRNGLLCLGIGLFCFVTGGSLIFVFPKQPAVAMLPVMLSYAFMIVGGYRAVLGKTPEPSYPGEVSFKRVAFGVGTMVAVMGALVGLLFLANFIYELAKRVA